VSGPRIERVETSSRDFPTPQPEADGTLEWTKTTAVTVTLSAGGETGLGWTYSSSAAEAVVHDKLSDAIEGSDAFAVDAGWEAMRRACRNLGTRGLVGQAISAVDIAWWDLKARLLGVSLSALFGRHRERVPVYGSGGFTTLSDEQLAEQVEHWRGLGCDSMKIKIAESWGGDVARDLARMRALRTFAGDDAQLMADANGGYTRGQARRVGAELDELGVVWFEEPVSSDDVRGLALLRDVLQCDVTAGEYASDSVEIAALLPVVDCIQLDVTRCGGYTGWLRGAAAARAAQLDVSGHCAPALHAPVAAAIPHLRHVEYFVDHERIEAEMVTGAPEVSDGAMLLRDTVGHGMRLR
jgi:L-alanine-DL-glutamate epimerase-like enolase superfamily enzyme